MNRLSTERRAQILGALVEGSSIRATVRMTSAAKGTVLKLLTDIGEVCVGYHDVAVRGLRCKRIQCDEIWSFCYSKDKNVPDHMRGQPGVGDVWTWIAMCADTKLIASWHVGSRDSRCAHAFMKDLASRMANPIQLTTDGHRAYLEAVPDAFETEVEYAMLVKLYGESADGEIRYSPCDCVGARKTAILGNPNPEHISTSYVERQNLTMRMGMRRFTRLTNAFSKKLVNLKHAVALHTMHYNFCRRHQTLGTTPAVAAGLDDHQWGLTELVGLLD